MTSDSNLHVADKPTNSSQDAAAVQPEYHPNEFYAPFLSNLTKNRLPSPIRSLFPLENRPGMISLLAGKPNPTTFPITSISISARTPGDDPQPDASYNIAGPALAEALQYSPTSGLPRLVEWVTRLQEHAHSRQSGQGWRVSLGAGSQDLLYKAFHALVDEGDPVLIESPAYAGVLPILQSLKADLIEVETDADGISATSLNEILQNWPAGKRRPRILYSVPFGCNPTGMTATLERRLAVLAAARAHNLLILEDDPYFYLYFGTRPRPPSFFALDAQGPGPAGRVLRFDSLSKILSAGMRLGFVTGPAELLRVIDMHTAIANLQPSSLVQAVAHALLDDWGVEGFLAHTRRVSALYRERRDVFARAMHQHLGGLATWVVPEAGMFFWFELRLPDKDSAALIRTQALEHGVLALPGTVFLPNGRKTAYVRASFSLLTEDNVHEALRRLAEVIRKAQDS